MDCPTCKDKMDRLGGMSDGRTIHWCPACGTVHDELMHLRIPTLCIPAEDQAIEPDQAEEGDS